MNIKYRISNMYHSVRYAIQRVCRGYDDRDVFEFYDSFIKRNVKILKSFKENLHGHPGDLTEEEWDNVLQEIIDCLENSDENTAIEKLFGGHVKFLDNPDNEKYSDLDAYINQKKDRAFDLIRQWFFNLWD